MKLKERNKRILTACLMGMFVIGFSLTSIEQFVRPLESKSATCMPGEIESFNNKPFELIGGYEIKETTSHPLAFLFQIMFILFLISPPIIALMLFCIWKELKKRNDLK